MPSVFTRIVRGELPAFRVAETDHCLAFLDINPIQRGHTLVIPKQEIDYIFDVPDPLYTELWQFARRVGRAIQTVIPCNRIGIAVIGLEVPHAHIHLVPINTMADLDFSRPRLRMSAEEMKGLAREIGEAYRRLFE